MSMSCSCLSIWFYELKMKNIMNFNPSRKRTYLQSDLAIDKILSGNNAKSMDISSRDKFRNYKYVWLMIYRWVIARKMYSLTTAIGSRLSWTNQSIYGWYHSYMYVSGWIFCISHEWNHNDINFRSAVVSYASQLATQTKRSRDKWRIGNHQWPLKKYRKICVRLL